MLFVLRQTGFATAPRLSPAFETRVFSATYGLIRIKALAYAMQSLAAKAEYSIIMNESL